MIQFGLISLIPGLIRHLEDCADPELDSYEKSMVQPSSLRTSDRNSCGSLVPCMLCSLTGDSVIVYGASPPDFWQGKLVSHSVNMY